MILFHHSLHAYLQSFKNLGFCFPLPERVSAPPLFRLGNTAGLILRAEDHHHPGGHEHTKHRAIMRPHLMNVVKIAHALLQFVESIRSFMFGDGDPNREAYEVRWELIGEYITSKGGVVAAEELAPYLIDPSEAKGKNDSHPMNEETYMLPVLMRYEGHPVIDEENGNVLYRFISLQPTAKELSDPNFVKKGKPIENKFFRDKEWRFSKTNLTERAVLVCFCGLCWEGILKLTEGLLLETPIAPGGYVKFFSTILPLLQAFVISITMIPSLRFLLFCIFYLKRNADIRKRNLTRQQCCRDLSSPDLALRRKLQTARDMAKRLTIVMSAGEEDRMCLYVNVCGTKMSS